MQETVMKTLREKGRLLTSGRASAWISAALGLWVSASAASPLLIINPAAPQWPASPEAVAPDFNGDGRADYFEIRRDVAGRRTEDRASPADEGAAPAYTCVHVGLRDSAGEQTQRRAYCNVWTVSTLPAPDRGVIPGRSPWVARLSQRLFIPQLGYLPSSRDAVLLNMDSRPGVLFYDGQQYVLHQGLDLTQVIHQEALEAFSRFEQPR